MLVVVCEPSRMDIMNTRTLTALPVYNESKHVHEILKSVRKYADDILVVDDGSSDGTHEALLAEPGIHVITHKTNQGYGAALNSAFQFAVQQGFDVLVTIDCDGQHQPKLIPQFAARVFENTDQPIDMVSGSRYLEIFPGDSTPPEERRTINRAITDCLNENLNLRITDAFCGFKAYRVSSLSDLDVTEFGYAMPLQLWVQAVRAEWQITEIAVPLIYLEEERSFGGSLDDSERRLAYYKQVLQREYAAAFNTTRSLCD